MEKRVAMEKDPVYIAKLAGCVRDSDRMSVKLELEADLDARVVVIDSRFDYIAELRPQDASELVELARDFVAAYEG